MGPEQSRIIIIDDTIFPFFNVYDEDKFKVGELLLNYFSFVNSADLKYDCIVETSGKIWSQFYDKDRESHQYIKAMVKPCDLVCNDGQTNQQTICEMLNVYSKKYDLIIVISGINYDISSFDNVVQLSIESIPKFTDADKGFKEFLSEAEKCRELVSD